MRGTSYIVDSDWNTLADKQWRIQGAIVRPPAPVWCDSEF